MQLETPRLQEEKTLSDLTVSTRAEGPSEAALGASKWAL